MLLSIQDSWFDPYAQAIQETLQTEQAARRAKLVQAEQLLRRWCKGIPPEGVPYALVREHLILLHEDLMNVVVDLLPAAARETHEGKLLSAIAVFDSQFAQWQLNATHANHIAALFAEVQKSASSPTNCYAHLYGISLESACDRDPEQSYDKATRLALGLPIQQLRLLCEIENAYALHLLGTGDVLDAFSHYNSAILYGKQWLRSLLVRHYRQHDIEVIDAGGDFGRLAQRSRIDLIQAMCSVAT